MRGIEWFPGSNPLGYRFYPSRTRYDKYKGSFEWDSLDRTSQNHSSKQSDQSEIDTILLLGISGIGKTTAVEEIVADLNQVILHESYEGHLFIRTQIVFLIVDCPAKATIGGFLRQVLMAFDKALGNTNYFEKSKRKTIDTMLSEVVSLVSEYHVGIIILDEINHLVNNRQSDSELSNLLTTLTNLINIPLVFVGTYKAEDLLCQNLRTTRRILKNGYLNWNRLEEDSQEWQFFINELLRLQYTLTFNEPTEELKHVLYDVSQGILAIAVSVFGRTQRKVILDELNPEEIITAQDIQETLKSDFSFLVPMLKAIKNKQTRKLIGYEDIYDQLDLLGESLKISPKEEEKAKRAFNKEMKKIREERKRRPQKLFDKLKQLSLFTFISDDELENLIIELLKDNTVTTLPESEILQTILIEALNLEQEKREDFNKNKVKTEEELSELETPAQQLNT